MTVELYTAILANILANVILFTLWSLTICAAKWLRNNLQLIQCVVIITFNRFQQKIPYFFALLKQKLDELIDWSTNNHP